MNKDFTTEFEESDEDEQEQSPAQIPVGIKNYITPAGFRRLKDELDQLWKSERPALVQDGITRASKGRSPPLALCCDGIA